MARPRRSHGTRERLLEEGVAAFTVQGYHGTGISEIVDSVGVPKGSFYNYFPSKEAFVAELIRRYSDTLREQLHALIEHSDGDVLEVMRTAYQAAAAMHEGNDLQGCLIGNLTAEVAPDNEACSAAVRQAMATFPPTVATAPAGARSAVAGVRAVSTSSATRWWKACAKRRESWPGSP